MEKDEEKKDGLLGRNFDCPLCGERLDIRLDNKHKKPYVICDLCGVQLFIRKPRGIRKLQEKIDSFFGF